MKTIECEKRIVERTVVSDTYISVDFPEIFNELSKLEKEEFNYEFIAISMDNKSMKKSYSSKFDPTITEEIATEVIENIYKLMEKIDPHKFKSINFKFNFDNDETISHINGISVNYKWEFDFGSLSLGKAY